MTAGKYNRLYAAKTAKLTLSDDVPDAELHSFILVVESDIDFERYLDPLRWPTLNNQPAKNIHKVVKEYYGY
ncbi:unknown [Candidatus Apopatosoma intestinale]|nr:unknown [Candidatus Apopatosoma intestinale]